MIRRILLAADAPGGGGTSGAEPQPTPETANAGMAALKSKMASLAEQNESLKKKVTSLTDENTSLRNTVSSLAGENSRLNAQVKSLADELEALKAADAQRAADEKLITEKMARGLSRAQAIEVIKRQRTFDAERARAAKEAKAKK